jgi:hypothetical protein
VADSKLMTKEHVTQMNDSTNHIDFVSRYPANFSNKLESKTITKAYARGNGWSLDVLVSQDACSYRGMGFTQEVFGASLRLVVLESSSLRESAVRAYEKQRLELNPLVVKLCAQVFKNLSDAQFTCEQFRKNASARLFGFVFDIVSLSHEVWPAGRRGKDTVPQIRYTYQIKVLQINCNTTVYEEFMAQET